MTSLGPIRYLAQAMLESEQAAGDAQRATRRAQYAVARGHVGARHTNEELAYQVQRDAERFELAMSWVSTGLQAAGMANGMASGSKNEAGTAAPENAPDVDVQDAGASVAEVPVEETSDASATKSERETKPDHFGDVLSVTGKVKETAELALDAQGDKLGEAKEAAEAYANASAKAGALAERAAKRASAELRRGDALVDRILMLIP